MLKKILAAVVMLYAAIAMAAVDVNKATEAELDNVKGIGPVTSKLIMAERKKGAFKNWDDFVSRVKGLGESRAAKLSEDGLRVNGSAFKAASGTAVGDDKKNAKKDAKAGDSKPAAAATKTSAADAKPATGAAPAVAAAPAKGTDAAAKK